MPYYEPDYLTYQSPHLANVVSGESRCIVPANELRHYLAIVNNSDTDIFLCIGAAATAGRGIRISADGGSFEMVNGVNLSTQAIYARHGGAGNKNICYQEAVKAAS